MSTEQIYHHFRHFGEIESLTTSYCDDSRYIFVIFRNARSALESVTLGTHRINEKSVTVYLNEMYSTFININLLLVPTEHESPRHIINSLPDECVLEILKNLDVKDLANAADTCSKFRDIAKTVFTDRFSYVNESSLSEMDGRTLARFFRNFGKSMVSFELDCSNMVYGTRARYLEIFCRHCADPVTALREMKILNFRRELQFKFEQPLQLLISQLTSLSLMNCDGLTFSFGKRQ